MEFTYEFSLHANQLDDKTLSPMGFLHDQKEWKSVPPLSVQLNINLHDQGENNQSDKKENEKCECIWEPLTQN